MLQNLTYLFPQEESSDFYKYLLLLLEELPNSKKKQSGLILNSIHPTGAKPTTTIQLSDTDFPYIHFEMVQKVILPVGNLLLASTQNYTHQHTSSQIHVIEHERTDSLGNFIEFNTDKQQYYLLPLEELYKRISSHIIRIDHTGVNLPSSLVTRDKYSSFVEKLSQESNIYRYPTGEDWPFILPTTKDEFKKDIKYFPVGREPKFELVYDAHASEPTIQFDIETDLTREEVEKLLPEPYGVSFPDLADYFRTVYIHHKWAGLQIRFDIRFKNDTPDGDWETGKWLVKEGGRVIK